MAATSVAFLCCELLVEGKLGFIVCGRSVISPRGLILLMSLFHIDKGHFYLPITGASVSSMLTPARPMHSCTGWNEPRSKVMENLLLFLTDILDRSSEQESLIYRRKN